MIDEMDKPHPADFTYGEFFDSEGYNTALKQWHEEMREASFDAICLEVRQEAGREGKRRSREAAERKAAKRKKIAWQRARRIAVPTLVEPTQGSCVAL